MLGTAELVEYLIWRRSIFETWASRIEIPSERGLVGQFLSIHLDRQPSEDYVSFLESLRDKPSDFDISSFLQSMGERIVFFEGSEKELGYYDILAEFAKLHRGDLREIKKRILLCIEAVEKDKFMRPTRIISAATGCGFVFIPAQKEVFERRKQGLKNFTYGAKYDSRLQKQVGVTFSKRGQDFHIEWALFDFPWKYDDEMEERLKKKNPFGSLKYEVRTRYNFEE